LNLKPRSKPAGEDGEEEDSKPKQRSSNPFGAAKPIAAGQSEDTHAGDKAAVDDDDDDDDRRVKPAPAAGKYVSPSVQKRMQEEESKRREREPQRDRDDDRRAPQRDRDDDRRAPRDGDGFEQVGSKKSSAGAGPASGGAGAYVPAARRREEEERKKREDDRQKKDEAEDKRRRDEEDAKKEAEKMKKLEHKERKEAESRAKKDAIVAAKPKRANTGPKDADIEVDEDKLSKLEGQCEDAVSDDKANISKLATEAVKKFTQDELRSVLPVSQVLLPLMQYCRMKADEEVVSAVKRFAPLLNSFIEKSCVHRFKVKVLCEAQKIANDMGLPRLSPASALIEVFFDGLYQAEIIEEDYFSMWTEHDDDTPGKINAMFQMGHFLDWLRDPNSMESDAEEGEEEEEEEAEKDEEEESDEDIEANVPQRNQVKVRPAF